MGQPDRESSVSSREISASEIFRQEALDHRYQHVAREGDLLRLSSGRLKWANWALVGCLVAGLAVAGRVEIEELASGPAVVRLDRTPDGDPEEGGGAPAACLVIGSVPARQMSAVGPVATGRFTSSRSGMVPLTAAMEVVNVMPVRTTDRAGRFVTEPHPPALRGGEPMTVVVGRLVPTASFEAASGVPCPDGVEGTIEVRLPPRKLLSALVPGAYVPSRSDR